MSSAPTIPPQLARWPVHPRPLPDETISSWLVRVARANGSSLSAWLAAALGRVSFAHDYNIESEDPALWGLIVERTALPGGLETLREMARYPTLSSATRWLLPNGLRAKRRRPRFCPQCLSTDAVPFLRRTWRFGWLLWCPVDGARLRDGCPECGAMLWLRRVPWRQPLTNCWQCDAPITRAAQDIGAPPLVRRSTTEALERLPHLLPDELETLWCLQRFARLFCARSAPQVQAARWPELLAAVGPACHAETLPTPAGADEKEAFTFAIAWHLLTAESGVVPLLARTFQGRFNQATAFRCSRVLLPLRQVVWSERTPMTADRVAAAIAELQRAEHPVHYATVARELGVDPSTFGKTPAWRALVDEAAPPVGPVRPARRRRRRRRRVGSRLQRHWVSEARKRLVACRDSLRAQGLRVSQQALSRGSGLSLHQIARFQRLSGESLAVLPRVEYATKVAAAVEALRARGARINTVAVTREMGRSRNLIEARPDLKAIVRAARVPAVTTAMVTAAIDAVLARGERVTTRGVSMELGRDRDPFYRKPGLLDLVKAAQARQHDEAAQRVRAAVAELQARSEPVTFRAVASAVGKDEHYFERPAQRGLRALVPSARARR